MKALFALIGFLYVLRGAVLAIIWIGKACLLYSGVNP